MKFSIQLLLGFLLWNGAFCFAQGEGQTPLREQLKEELRKELREELREEVRKEEGIRQEVRELVMPSCRNVLLKKCSFVPNMPNCEAKVKEVFQGIEDITVKKMLKDYPNDKDMRMGLYLVLRRKCEKV